MKILRKNLITKFLKIITLIIIIFSNSTAFAFTDPNHIDDFDISGVETISTSVKLVQMVRQCL